MVIGLAKVEIFWIDHVVMAVPDEATLVNNWLNLWIETDAVSPVACSNSNKVRWRLIYRLFKKIEKLKKA